MIEQGRQFRSHVRSKVTFSFRASGSLAIDEWQSLCQDHFSQYASGVL